MHVQHQNGIPQTVPKDTEMIMSHTQYKKRKNKYKNVNHHPLLCLLSLQRSPYLPSATVALLSFDT